MVEDNKEEKKFTAKPVTGTVFNLNELNPGTWFDIDGGGKICLRVCGSDKLREIRKQTVKKKSEYKKGGRFEFDVIDEDLQSKLIWDFCIVAWENLFDANGQQIPCNSDTKNALMGQSPAFSKIVTDAMKKLTDMESDEEEETELGKN